MGEKVATTQEHFRTLAETLPELVWTCLPDGQCDYFNVRWCEYTGRPLPALLGDGWRETMHPHDRERTCDYWLAALKGTVPYDLEYRLRRADGEYHWFKVRAAPLKDSRGNITKWYGVSTDIHAEKRSAEMLEKLVAERTAKLREAAADMEAFSYSITHDMRAPLRAMQGFAHILRAEAAPQLTDASKDYLRRIEESAQRMDDLIRDVLNYAKISRGELQLLPIDVEALLAGILASYPALQPPHAEVIVEKPLPRVIGNHAALTQCISNLLDNAIKFVAPGCPPRVRIWAQTKNGWARLHFEDNGIGIDKAAQQKIFAMFERVAQGYQGTGIGLAIVKKAVERMHGRVNLESEPGKGSTFRIELKVATENNRSPERQFVA